MSLEILIDLECSFTLAAEIYSYPIFLLVLLLFWLLLIQFGSELKLAAISFIIIVLLKTSSCSASSCC